MPKLTFELEISEEDNHEIWNHICRFKGNDGAIGGRIHYEFTPTGLGQIKRVSCDCGYSKDFTDSDNW